MRVLFTLLIVASLPWNVHWINPDYIHRSVFPATAWLNSAREKAWEENQDPEGSPVTHFLLFQNLAVLGKIKGGNRGVLGPTKHPIPESIHSYSKDIEAFAVHAMWEYGCVSEAQIIVVKTEVKHELENVHLVPWQQQGLFSWPWQQKLSESRVFPVPSGTSPVTPATPPGGIPEKDWMSQLGSSRAHLLVNKYFNNNISDHLQNPGNSGFSVPLSLVFTTKKFKLSSAKLYRGKAVTVFFVTIQTQTPGRTKRDWDLFAIRFDRKGTLGYPHQTRICPKLMKQIEVHVSSSPQFGCLSLYHLESFSLPYMFLVSMEPLICQFKTDSHLSTWCFCSC